MRRDDIKRTQLSTETEDGVKPYPARNTKQDKALRAHQDQATPH